MDEQLETRVPAQTSLLRHQIAGHYHGQGKSKLGMLKHDSGCILKPITPNDMRGIREKEFYEDIFNSIGDNQFKLEIKQFIPQYYGIWESNSNGSKIQYMKLEDTTASFSNPSIMDIKIGAQTFDPTASEDKKLREKAKFPFFEEIAFRILGMRVYQTNTEEYLLIGKNFGKEQTPDTLVKAIHTYFDNQNGRLVKSILNQFIAQLEAIDAWFQKQTELSFYSSSLLFVYEGNTFINQGETCSNTNYPVSVKMIDFAHVFPTQGLKDDNYIRGLQSLIKYFRKLLKTV